MAADDPVARVRKLLYRRLRVVLADGRTLLGDLQAFDKQGNLILGATRETVSTSSGRKEERTIGIVLIPRDQQKAVELEGTLEEKLQFAVSM
uniref:Sm domain-containing protein n=1 Tax=Chlamydomonas euryale TaxID=1486919 RepID=A0A7R9YU88_9CHLO